MSAAVQVLGNQKTESEAAEGLISALRAFKDSQSELFYLMRFIAKDHDRINSLEERCYAKVKEAFPQSSKELFATSFKTLREIFDTDTDDVPEGDDEAKRQAVEALTDRITELANTVSKKDRNIEGHRYVLRLINSVITVRRVTPRLRSSLLTTLIGDYEMLIGEVYRQFFAVHPESAISRDHSFTWDQIAEAGGLEELVSVALDNAVESALRGNYEDWLAALQRKFGLTVNPICRSDVILEGFQRRHVIVHNGGRVSRLYLARCPQSEVLPELGETLQVDTEYVSKLADSLLVSSVSIIGRSVTKITKDVTARSDLERYLGKTLYDLLLDQRFNTVRDITESESPSFTDEYSANIWKINGWLARKRLDEFSKCRREVEEWGTSHLSPEFQLAKLALLDDLESGMELVKKIRGTEHLSYEHWQTWPLLEELRAYEEDHNTDQEDFEELVRAQLAASRESASVPRDVQKKGESDVPSER